MKNIYTSAYKYLFKDPKFKKFLSDSLRFAQWKGKQSSLKKLKDGRYKKEIVVSLDDSEYTTIV